MNEAAAPTFFPFLMLLFFFFICLFHDNKTATKEKKRA